MDAKLNYMRKSLPMKHKNLFKWLVSGLVLTISATTTESYSQTKTRKLPDGTIIYPDGTYKLPNGEIRKKSSTRKTRLPDGTVIYPDGTVRESGDVASTRKTNRKRRLPDGTVIYPDGTVRNPDGTVHYPNGDRRNGKWLPPGQAKKKYGSKSARSYAPGQQKKNNSVYRHHDDKDWKDEPTNKDWKSKGRNKKKKG